jgi:hypothetical protein
MGRAFGRVHPCPFFFFQQHPHFLTTCASAVDFGSFSSRRRVKALLLSGEKLQHVAAYVVVVVDVGVDVVVDK